MGAWGSGAVLVAGTTSGSRTSFTRTSVGECGRFLQKKTKVRNGDLPRFCQTLTFTATRIAFPYAMSELRYRDDELRVVANSAKLSYDVCENAAALGSIAASWKKWHSKLPVRLRSARNKKPILPGDRREPVRGVTMFSFHPFDSLVKPISF